jgi:hypothetical protein
MQSHPLFEQACPEGQARPQLPQLAPSVPVFTHSPLQKSSSEEQVQLPLEHV